MPRGTERAPAARDPVLDDLRALATVAGCGSISEAALQLGRHKGAVSRQIARLERTVGARLLARAARATTLTEDGEAYLRGARAALTALDEAGEALRSSQTDARGHVRITAPADAAQFVLAPLLPELESRHPEISLEIIATERFLDLESHDLDLALRGAPSLRDSKLVAQRAMPAIGKLYASPDYLARRGRPASPRVLTEHALLLTTRGPTTLRARKAGRRTRVRVTAKVACRDFAILREAAIAGAGIALLPSFLVDSDVANGRIAPVLPAFDLFTDWLYLLARSRTVPRRVRAVRDFLLERLRARA